LVSINEFWTSFFIDKKNRSKVGQPLQMMDRKACGIVLLIETLIDHTGINEIHLFESFFYTSLIMKKDFYLLVQTFLYVPH